MSKVKRTPCWQIKDHKLVSRKNRIHRRALTHTQPIKENGAAIYGKASAGNLAFLPGYSWEKYHFLILSLLGAVIFEIT